MNVTILVRAKSPVGEVDTTSFARFYDQLERRAGKWKLWRRTAVYEKDHAAAVSRPSLPPEFFEGLERFPAEVRFLASSLERAGAKLSPALVRDKSPELQALYREGEIWLAGEAR